MVALPQRLPLEGVAAVAAAGILVATRDDFCGNYDLCAKF